MEIWKDIPGYEGQYQVSDLGKIRSLDRLILKSNGVKQPFKGIKLIPTLDKDGYERINLKGGRVNFCVHRLVIETFLGKSNLQVNHKNGIRNDNRLVNLELVTNVKNINHRYTILNNQSRYGVHFHKGTHKWRASISSFHLGLFGNKEDAYDIFYLTYSLVYGVAPW